MLHSTMLHLTSALLLALSLAPFRAHAAPLHQKRIAQVIADSTALWEKACLAANGGEQCNPLSVTAFTTLLAAAGPCDQQNAADSMIDLAKDLNNDPEMIKFTQIFVQQARNTPNSLAVPYCQQAPKNPELDGLFQCQFQGANQNTFVGGLALGVPGTIPFGRTQPLSPLGSCLAHSQGPIADGSQLTDVTQDPGLTNGAPPSGSTTATSPSSTAPTSSAPATSTSAVESTSTVASSSAPSSTSTSAPPSGSNFQLQNALDAQKLNAQFAALSADSPCNDGDQVCVEGGFAMCVGGRLVNMGCAAPTRCFALPLVNKPGTSLACTTEADAAARIAAPGATGGITGSGDGAQDQPDVDNEESDECEDD